MYLGPRSGRHLCTRPPRPMQYILRRNTILWGKQCSPRSLHDPARGFEFDARRKIVTCDRIRLGGAEDATATSPHLTTYNSSRISSGIDHVVAALAYHWNGFAPIREVVVCRHYSAFATPFLDGDPMVEGKMGCCWVECA